MTIPTNALYTIGLIIFLITLLICTVIGYRLFHLSSSPTDITLSENARKVQDVLRETYSTEWSVMEKENDTIYCYFKDKFKFYIVKKNEIWQINGEDISLNMLYHIAKVLDATI